MLVLVVAVVDEVDVQEEDEAVVEQPIAISESSAVVLEAHLVMEVVSAVLRLLLMEVVMAELLLLLMEVVAEALTEVADTAEDMATHLEVVVASLGGSQSLGGVICTHFTRSWKVDVHGVDRHFDRYNFLLFAYDILFLVAP